MKTYEQQEMKLQPTGKTITIHVYTFDELNEEAQERAFNDWRDSIIYYDIEDALQNDIDYEAQQALLSVNAEYDGDSYGNLWAYMHNAAIPQDGHAPKMDDRGYYATMDMAEAFNAHGPALEEYAAMWYAVSYPDTGSAFYECSEDTAYNLAIMYEVKYLDEYEEAVQDALNVWRELREQERDYLTSFEAFEDESCQGAEWYTVDGMGRKYYHDDRMLYYENGEFYGRSDTNHMCVSIVRAS